MLDDSCAVIRTGPRELTDDEIDMVAGGILPVVAFGLALAGKVTATNAVGWAIGSASLVLGTYELARYLGGREGAVH